MRTDAVFARIKRYLPWFAIFGAALFFFLPLIVEGTTFYAFDVLGNYWPWHGSADFTKSNNPILTDPLTVFYPPTFYLGHFHYQTALRHGGLAFWETSILGGAPYRHYLSPVYYLIFSLLPLTVAHDVLLFCGLCLVGTFTYLFLRRVGLSVVAGVFGALAFMFNGYLMAWFEFEHILALSVGLAGSLYFCEQLLAFRSWTSALAIALCLGASIAISHPQQSIYLASFVVCYFAYRAWVRWRNGEPGPQTRSLIFWFGLALAITAVLSSGYLIQGAGQIADSNRRSLPFSQLFRQTGSLPLAYLVTLVFPDFFGSPTVGWMSTPKPLPPQPYNNYCELCIYAGIPTLMLALMGLRLLRQRGLPRFFGGCALLTLLFAGGTVLYYPIAALVPGMNLSSPCRLLFLFGFSLSCLAAFSLDGLLDKDPPRRRLLLLSAPLGLLLLAAGVVLVLLAKAGPAWLWALAMGEQGSQHPEDIAGHFALGGSAFARPLLLIAASAALTLGLVLARGRRWRLLSGGALVALLFADLGGFAWKFNTRSPRALAFPSTPAIRFLQRDSSKFRVMSLAPFYLHNALTPFGIEDAGGYASFYSRRYGEYIFLSQDGHGDPPDQFSKWCSFRTIGSPLLDALNVKYVLMPIEASVPEHHFRLVHRGGDSQVYENLHAFPRAFLVREALVIPDTALRLEKLRSFSRRNFAQTVIVERDIRSPAANPPANEAVAPVEIARYQPDEIELRVDDAWGGFIILSDNFDSSWLAQVDGRPTEILRANHIMRAVPVGPGSHVITMRFMPRAEISGLLVSNVGWLTVAAAVVVGVARRRRTSRLATGSSGNQTRPEHVDGRERQ
jgi:hypothetical protein